MEEHKIINLNKIRKNKEDDLNAFKKHLSIDSEESVEEFYPLYKFIDERKDLTLEKHNNLLNLFRLRIKQLIEIKTKIKKSEKGITRLRLILEHNSILREFDRAINLDKVPDLQKILYSQEFDIKDMLPDIEQFIKGTSKHISYNKISNSVKIELVLF